MYEKLRRRLKDYNQVIDNDFWQEVVKHSKEVEIKKNQLLIDIGSRSKYAYFIVKGSFKTSIITEDGDKKPVWFNFDELFNMVTSPDSYFLDENSKYEVIALEDSQLIRFNKHNVENWVLKYPKFNHFYISDIITDFIAVNEIRAFKLSHSPLQFFNYINGKYPAIPRRLSSKNMAHFLGISPEWYSKLKKKEQS